MYVDTERWRRHQESVVSRYPGIVPVIKGNGYGVGLERLARVAEDFTGRILVLHPHHPAVPEPPLAEAVQQRVTRVVASVEAARKVGGSRTGVVLELLTSLRRHGVAEEDL